MPKIGAIMRPIYQEMGVLPGPSIEVISVEAVR